MRRPDPEAPLDLPALRHPRIVGYVEYGPRWRSHQVRIQAESDLDAALRAWLRESYEVVGLER